MKIRILVLLLVLALPGAAWSQGSSRAFTITDKSASSVSTDGSGNLGVGYSRIVPDNGKTTPSGVAIFGFRSAGVLVTEAGVPASPLLKNGRIYAEVNGGLGGADIGLAIANPNSAAATITFSSTKTDGTASVSGTLTIAANGQTAQFLDQSPINIPTSFQGTFTFSSTVPISVIALKTLTNERGDFLITTLPVIDTTVAASTSAAVLPHFADGGGWTTSVLLVNPGSAAMSGTIQFRDGTGAATTLTANGIAASSFAYTVNGSSSFKLLTAGAGSATASGSVTITPAAGTSTPVPLVVFAFKSGGITVSQAGVPANSGTAFRMYAEGSGTFGAIGSISSGVAVANASPTAGTVTFDAFDSTGASLGLTNSYTVAGSGQLAKFIGEIFPTLALPFQGVLRIRTTTPAISVVGLRGRYNERGDFLITTTPPTNEGAAASTSEFDFPHIVNGGGYTTQFVLFSGAGSQSTTGSLVFLNQTGTSLTLTGVSQTAAAPTLTSISPTSAVRTGTVILSGTGFSSTAANNTVVFTTAAGTVSAAPSSSTATSLTVSVPATAITGPVLVQVGGQSSSSLILQVTGTATTLAPATTMSVTAGATTTGGDIYVPPAVAGLNLTSMGVGDPGTSISTGTSSIEVARSTTKQMVLIGTGLSTTTVVSVSGTGVNMSNASFQNGVIFVTIQVDASAATGARNIIVTNSNLDTSVMTGGMFVK